MIRYAYIVCCLFLHLVSIGQVTIQGTVADSVGNKLSSVTVSLIDRNGLILSYGFSDDLGTYKISYSKQIAIDKLSVCAQAFGFISDTIKVPPNEFVVNFVLHSSPQTLQSVTVYNTQKSIRRQGDTIRYNVDSFSHPQDRVILDVIKKLPGIEVSDDGMIKFQGKPINRLYVDGDNVLDGKYNALTVNLPNNMVASVEVLQSHQPIRSLRGLDISDAAALNIVLKEKARLKFIGEAEAAGGHPGLYDFTGNGMFFGKVLKSVNSIKITNAGKGLSASLLSHFDSDPDLRQQRPILVNEIINPPLSTQRYLFAEAKMGDINIMVKKRNGIDFKFNGSFLTESKENRRQFSQSFFFPNDTVQYAESFITTAREISFRPKLTVTLNRNRYYLNNSLEVDLNAQNANSAILSSLNDPINEIFKTKKNRISNVFQLVTAVSKKAVLEAYSFIILGKIPQSNLITPGLYIGELNGNQPYTGLVQSVILPTLSTRHYLALKIPGSIIQSYKFGSDWQRDEISSVLQKQLANGTQFAIADTFVNQLNWTKQRSYAEAKFSHVSNQVQYELQLPVEFYSISYADRSFEHSTQSLFFQPSVRIKARITKESSLLFQSGFKSSFGNIHDVYEGYILNSYRTFKSQGGILPLNRRLTHTLTYEWNKVPQFLFVTATTSYSTLSSNTIGRFEVSSRSIRFRNTRLDNVITNFNSGVQVSKYISPLRSTVATSWLLSFSENNHFQNGFLIEYITRIIGIAAKLDSRFGSKLAMTYELSLLRYRNQPIAQHDFNVQPQESGTEVQKLALTYIPIPTLQISGSGDYYSSQAAGRSKNRIAFVDISVTYKPLRSKIDVRLALLNLLNNTNYRMVNSGSNGVSETAFEVRPRNLLLAISYRL